MKRARPGGASAPDDENSGASSGAESDLMSVVCDMSRQIEEKADRLNLRSASVRRIIKEVLSDQDVVSMFREYLRCDGSGQTPYEPKLTRSLAKRRCLETVPEEAEAAAAANEDDNEDDDEDGDYVASEDADAEDEEEDDDEDTDGEEEEVPDRAAGVVNDAEANEGDTTAATAATAAAAAAQNSYATRSRCPIPDFSWEKCEEAILKSDFYLGDFAVDDNDRDAEVSSMPSCSGAQQLSTPLQPRSPESVAACAAATAIVEDENAATQDEDNDEAEFRNFLRDIYLDRIEQSDPPNEAEEDADFNVMAEPEEVYQEDFFDDLRYNRAARIPKRELRDLLDEICSDLYEEQAAGHPLHQLPELTSAPPSPEQRRQLQEREVEDAADDSQDQSVELLALGEFTAEQKLELSKQLTMYVQLLCTLRITCHQQAGSLATAAQLHLTELKSLADAHEARAGTQSIFHVANLNAAVDLATNFNGLSDNGLIVRLNEPQSNLAKSAPDGASVSNQESAESTSIMPPELCGLMLSSPVFPYAQLFPPGMAAIVKSCKRFGFTPSEDRLLLLGMAQFGHRHDVFYLISKYTMPWRSRASISARCNYLSKIRSLLFKDSLCPTRIMVRSVILNCLRRRRQFKCASQTARSSSSASAASSSSNEPGLPQPQSDADVDFSRFNWISSVPLLEGCVLDRPSDWRHLSQLFRLHLLLERPHLRGQLLKPTEPTPLERDTALDRATVLFNRSRTLFKDLRRERLLAVKVLWRNPQLAPPVAAAAARPRLLLRPRRRGYKKSLTVRETLQARGRQPHDRSPTRLPQIPLRQLSPVPRPPQQQLPLDSASAECAKQVKRTVKEYLFSRLQSASPPLPLLPPPPPPPPPADSPQSSVSMLLCNAKYRQILPKPSTAGAADTCRIASDLILTELRSQRRNRLLEASAAATAATTAAAHTNQIHLVSAANPIAASPPTISFMTVCVWPTTQPTTPDNNDAIADVVQYEPPLPKGEIADAVFADNVDCEPPDVDQTPSATAAAPSEDALALSPETIPTLSCLPYLSDFLQSNTFKELRRGRWKPGRSGRLDQENLDQLVTDDPCEADRVDGGVDDDRDIEFASAFLRCLRTELGCRPAAYWEVLQAISQLAEKPGLDQVGFYQLALSAIPAQAACSRSMLAGFVSVEAALRVDALTDHLSVWRNRCLVRKIHRQLREQKCKSPIVLHRFEKSLTRWMSSAVSASDNDRLAKLIDDLDTTFKYFPYCLSEALSQFPEVPCYAESRDAFEYLDLTSPHKPDDVVRHPPDSVFETLPESLGLHEDRTLSCSCACHLTASSELTASGGVEAPRTKEAAAGATAANGERRVLRHCDNCALVSRHHMLLVEKLESRRRRHYDYACVQFPPDFRPRSDLPPAPQVDAEVVVPIYPSNSSQLRQNRRSQGQQQQQQQQQQNQQQLQQQQQQQQPPLQQHRAAESAALLEETFAVTIREAALYAEDDKSEARSAIVQAESAAAAAAKARRRSSSSAPLTPHDFELMERRRPLFESLKSGRRRLAGRDWTEAEDRIILQHCQANGFSAGVFRHLSANLLEHRNPECVRQRFRHLMQSYLAARGADYSAADIDDLCSDCEDA